MFCTRLFRAFPLVALLTIAMPTPAHADPVITNGGFELDSYVPGGYPYPPVTGWNVVYGPDVVGFLNDQYLATPYGSQFLELGPFASIDQTVTGFTPGNLYDLSFAAASQHGSGVPRVEVSFPSGSPTADSTFTLTSAADFTNWQPFTVVFQAASTSVNIKFAQPNSSIDDIALDNISLSPHIVPEPACLSILVPAAALVFRRRR